MAVKNLYALLGVSTQANAEQIQQAYVVTKVMLSEIEDPARRTQRLDELREALEILSDPIRKGVYDARLANEGTATGKPATPSAQERRATSARTVRLSSEDKTFRARYIFMFMAGMGVLFFGFAWYVIHLKNRPVESLVKLVPPRQESAEEQAEKKAYSDAMHQLEEAEAGLQALDQEWIQFKRTGPTSYAKEIEARKFEALREPLVAQRVEARKALARVSLSSYPDEESPSAEGHFR